MQPTYLVWAESSDCTIGMRTLVRRATCRKGGDSGFSLIEVILALAILVFASASIISLIPIGLTTFRQAMNNTIESEIVQSLVNNISMTNFSNLKNMASSQGTTYYFDADANPLSSNKDALYTVQVSFTDLSPSSTNAPLNTLAYSSGTTALITITKIDRTKDYFSVVVGNNQQVSAAPTPATW